VCLSDSLQHHYSKGSFRAVPLHFRNSGRDSAGRTEFHPERTVGGSSFPRLYFHADAYLYHLAANISKDCSIPLISSDYNHQGYILPCRIENHGTDKKRVGYIGRCNNVNRSFYHLHIFSPELLCGLFLSFCISQTLGEKEPHSGTNVKRV